MSKAIALSNIAITHISLVKAGANGKQVIYKSAANEGGYEHTIDIKKNDEEKGVIYGIVYAPEEVDSQGEFATPDEIEKAAYAFMKARNTTNVDVDHSFEPEAAFVAESWIVKGGDTIFPDEPEGSWAVAIKLEDESLKALAKSGELAGISMAGVAQKTEVEKGEDGKNKKAYLNFFETLAEATTGMWVDFGTYIEKGEGGTMAEKAKDFAKIMKEKLVEATKEAGAQLDQLAKDRDTHVGQIEELQKSAKDASEKMEALQKTNDELTQSNEKLADDVKVQTEANEKLTEANKTLSDENKGLKETVEKHTAELSALKKSTDAVTEAVKTSNQKKTVNKKVAAKDTKGVM